MEDGAVQDVVEDMVQEVAEDLVSVRWEACAVFVHDRASPFELCSCGWAEDEHPGPEPEVTVATVTALRATSVALRRAS